MDTHGSGSTCMDTHMVVRVHVWTHMIVGVHVWTHIVAGVHVWTYIVVGNECISLGLGNYCNLDRVARVRTLDPHPKKSIFIPLYPVRNCDK